MVNDKVNNENLIKFRDTQLTKKLKSRHPLSTGAAARTCIKRYLALLEDAMRTVELTQQEACLIVDALNGTMFCEQMTRSAAVVLHLEIKDSISFNRLDEKWSVDADILLEKINNFSPLQAIAVIDAVERVWNFTDERYYKSDEDFQKSLRTVGLVK